MTAATYTLPKPISVNRLKGPKSSHLSKRYREWKAEAEKMLREAGVFHIGGRVCVEIEIPPTSKIDLDNGAKAVIDALEKSGAIDNDRNVRRVVIREGDLPATIAHVSPLPPKASGGLATP